MVTAIVDSSASLEAVAAQSPMLIAISDSSTVVDTPKPARVAGLLHGLLFSHVNRLVHLLDLSTINGCDHGEDENDVEQSDEDLVARHVEKMLKLCMEMLVEMDVVLFVLW